MEVAVGSLVLNAVKAAYGLWKEKKVDALELTEGAKALLELMQSDDTGHGAVLDVTGLGTADLRFSSPYKTEISGSTTQRVWVELEAKGLVEEHVTRSGKTGIKLTHFGWILNPGTGKVDKVG